MVRESVLRGALVLLAAALGPLALPGTAAAQAQPPRAPAPTPPPRLDDLVRAFEQEKGKAYAERYATLERFAELAGDERAAQYVEGIAKGDADPSIRRAAFSVLGRVGTAGARAALAREAAAATDPYERAAALDALARTRPLPDRTIFRAACAPASPAPVRVAGVRGLAAYADAAAAEELIALLVPPAADGAPQPGADTNRAVLDALRDMPDEVAGRAIVARVLSLPKGRAPWLKAELLPIAAASGALAASPETALALTREPDPAVRGLAAHALARGSATEEVVERLIDLLKDKDDEVAAAAAGALARHAPPAALEPLLKAVEKQGPVRMGAAAAALGSYPGSSEAFSALDKIVRKKKKPWQAVAGAISALMKFRERRTIALLIEALEDLDGRLAGDAQRALEDLSGLDIGADPAEWRAWWKAVGDHFEVPPPGRRDKASGRSGTVSRNPTFYGQEVVSKRVCFIVDLSGSMNAEMRVDDGPPATRMEVAKRELKRVVDGLADDAWFNIILFGTAFRSWKPTITAATPAARREAHAHVDDARGMGGTNIFDPLESALADPNVDTIYLLSDGGPSAGRIVEPNAILEEVRRLNQGRRIAIHTLSVGEKSPFMRRLAEQNGGVYVER